MEIKKVRVNKQYGEWFYTKETPNLYNDLEFTLYSVYNKDKTESWTTASYSEMILFCKEPTQEAREAFARMFA